MDQAVQTDEPSNSGLISSSQSEETEQENSAEPAGKEGDESSRHAGNAETNSWLGTASKLVQQYGLEIIVGGVAIGA